MLFATLLRFPSGTRFQFGISSQSRTKDLVDQFGNQLGVNPAIRFVFGNDELPFRFGVIGVAFDAVAPVSLFLRAPALKVSGIGEQTAVFPVVGLPGIIVLYGEVRIFHHTAEFQRGFVVIVKVSTVEFVGDDDLGL